MRIYIKPLKGTNERVAETIGRQAGTSKTAETHSPHSVKVREGTGSFREGIREGGNTNIQKTQKQGRREGP